MVLITNNSRVLRTRAGSFSPHVEEEASLLASDLWTVQRIGMTRHGRMYLNREIATSRAISSAHSSEGNFVLLAYVTHGSCGHI